MFGRKFDVKHHRQVVRSLLHAAGLEAVEALASSGKMTATEISKKSGLAKTTLSAMLTRMDEQGLIAMEESSTDKRSVCISLTEKAAALKEEYDAVTREIEDIYYKGFTDSEVEQFENYLKRILANLGDK